MCARVLVSDGVGGVKGVHGVHEASLPYQRHARLFCPNGNYTAHNWRSLLGSQQEGGKKRKKKKRMEGGGGILKGSWGGGTIGLGFQVMLIPLIYLISGWRWSLFTSDASLLEETDEKDETEGENDEDEQVPQNRTKR